MCAFLLVSDVDGTLLDQHGRSAVPAGELRQGMQTALPGATLALASSRTLSELAVIQRWLRIDGPRIAEDGALLARAEGVEWLAAPREVLLNEWRRHNLQAATGLREVAQLNDAELHARGMATAGRRRRALDDRWASLLLDVAGCDHQQWATSRSALERLGFATARGGRWATLTRRASKGKALARLRAVSPPDLVIIAVGNDENDASMLAGAHMAFALRRSDGTVAPELAQLPQVTVLDRPSTLGWLDMLALLRDLRRRRSGYFAHACRGP